MPRCFMAKKLKYPYEQWKQEQQSRKSTSRSPSPTIVPDRSDDEDEEPMIEVRSNSGCSRQSSSSQSPEHSILHGKWC
jgi:hypothetical protein